MTTTDGDRIPNLQTSTRQRMPDPSDTRTGSRKRAEPFQDDGPAEMFRNPVLAGFHPDPSICATTDGRYLMATSSFEYFPGIPLHISDDLVTWHPIGHALDRPEQLNLTDIEYSDGLWAPTIRQQNGVYYLVVTLCRDRRGSETVLLTSHDPAGDWSDPTLLTTDGIDPSLFFDRDGTCWFTACRDNPEDGNPAELWSQELNLATRTLTGPQYVLWHGAMTGAWAEGPHIYEHAGTYWLIAAEGGTERNHAVTAASAATVTGPYRTLPANPVLTHRHFGASHPVQNVGHADLIDTPDGETWAVVLGVRPQNGHHVLGREVFLVPVAWEERGPVFAPDHGQARLTERRPAIGSTDIAPAVTTSALNRFDVSSVAELSPWDSKVWSTLRHPAARSGVQVMGGTLTLALLPGGPDGRAPQATLLRRQQHHRFVASVELEFDPNRDDDEAGLVVMQHRLAFTSVSVERVDGSCWLSAKLRSSDEQTYRLPAPQSSHLVKLVVEADGETYRFSAWFEGAVRPVELPLNIANRYLSTEEAGGFTGVQLGPFATAHGHASTSVAAFSNFVYEPDGC